MRDVIGCELKTCAEKNSGTKLDASIDEIEEYGKIFCIAWYHAKTTSYEPLFTGNQHTMTDYLAKRLTILFHTKGLRYETRREEQKCFRLRRQFGRRNQALEHCFN